MPPGRGLDAYREVWLVDFEFSAPPGERPDPVCLVAREFRSGRTLRLWQDDLRGRRVPPYPIGSDVLFVAYFASAELGENGQGMESREQPDDELLSGSGFADAGLGRQSG